MEIGGIPAFAGGCGRNALDGVWRIAAGACYLADGQSVGGHHADAGRSVVEHGRISGRKKGRNAW